MSSWIPLGQLPSRELREARLELHHAVQLVSIAVGRRLVPHRDDDSHTTLTWRGDARQWVGEEIPQTDGWRAGLRPADLTLTIGNAARPAEHELALGGKTLDDGLAWLRDRLNDRGQGAEVALDFHYEMPEHPLASGARFHADLAPGFEELEHYFANAGFVLQEVALANEGASPILTWPHHFDIGMVLPAGAEGDVWSRNVGVGLSPGDESYPEPYLYVNAYPRPETSDLPALPRGHWHTRGFFAAVLKAEDLLEGQDEGQILRAREFLSAAIAGAGQLLH